MNVRETLAELTGLKNGLLSKLLPPVVDIQVQRAIDMLQPISQQQETAHINQFLNSPAPLDKFAAAIPRMLKYEYVETEEAPGARYC